MNRSSVRRLENRVTKSVWAEHRRWMAWWRGLPDHRWMAFLEELVRMARERGLMEGLPEPPVPFPWSSVSFRSEEFKAIEQWLGEIAAAASGPQDDALALCGIGLYHDWLKRQ